MITLRHPVPRTALFVLGISVGIALVALPLFGKMNSLVSEQQHDYGQALVDSIARESMEASFRQDLISLGAIVQSITEYPSVQQVTIRNVENRVLVQSGKEQHQLEKNTLTFHATITLQDSVAGIVVLTLASEAWPQALFARFYLTLTIVCIGLFLWLCWQSRCIHIQLPRPNRSVNNIEAREHDQNDDSNDDEESRDTQNQPIDPISLLEYAHAALCIKNVAVLQQQLNGETFRKTFNELEIKLNQIGQLYGATDCHWERDRYLMKFGSAHQEDALFHASCAARLMLDLAGIVNRVPLDLSAQISVDRDNVLEAYMPFVGLAVHELGDAQALIAEKVEFINISDEDVSRKLISEFHPPYCELLKKQMAQIGS